MKPIILVLSILLPSSCFTSSNHRKLLGDAIGESLSIFCGAGGDVTFLFGDVSVPLDHIELTLLENHYRQLIHIAGNDGLYSNAGDNRELNLFLQGAYRKRMRPVDDARRPGVLQHSAFRPEMGFHHFHGGAALQLGIIYVYEVGDPIPDLPLRALNRAEIDLLLNFRDANWPPEYEQFVLDFYYQFRPVIDARTAARLAILDPNGGVRPGAANRPRLSWEEIEYGGTIAKEDMEEDMVQLVDEWEVGNRLVSLCNVTVRNENQIPKHVTSYESYRSLTKDECPACRGSGHLKSWVVAENTSIAGVEDDKHHIHHAVAIGICLLSVCGTVLYCLKKNCKKK